MKTKITERSIAALKPGKVPYEVMDTELKGFCARVLPSGGITFNLRYTLRDGSRGRIKLGPVDVLTVEQARDAARDKLADVTKGVDPKAERKATRMPTLGEFVAEQFYPLWLKSKRCGDETQANMEQTFADLWKLPLTDITPGRVEKWRAALLADDRKPSTVNRHLDNLKSCLSRAVEWEVLEEHPLARMKRIKQDKRPKVRYLSPEEETKLYDALDAREEEMRTERDSANKWRRDRGYAELFDLRKIDFVDHLKPIVMLAIHTGMRRGELFSLEWSDVDLERAQLTVRGDVAKSGTTRHIDLNSIALDVLRRWKKQTQAHGYAFPSPTGARLDNIKTSWEALLVRAKIDDFRFHDLRHTFASKLVQAGVDLNTVRELLGHADIKMTLRYSHLAPKAKAAAVEKLVTPRGKIVPFRNSRKKA